MAMPRELRHAINHIEQRLECPLLTETGRERLGIAVVQPDPESHFL
jgi:hypothetical protein